MKILIFAALYHPFKGGYTESIHELAKRLVLNGHTITIVTCNTLTIHASETINGVEVIRLPCINPSWLNKTFPIPLPTPRTFILIRKVFRQKPDIISTQTRFFPTSWLGFFIGKFLHIPVVHTERGATHSIASSRIVSWLGTFVDHTLGSMLARFSNATIAVSEASCQFLKHLGTKNPVKIYNGVDVEFWKKPVGFMANETRQFRAITFVGRLIYAKGVQDLFYAVAELKKQDSAESTNLIVNIVGDGAYRSTLEILAKKLSLNDTVRFLGEMTKEQIRDILWQTDLFVNPSHSEGLPRSVLEAAAAGCPIIATDIGGTREIIDENHGILVAIHNSEGLAQAIKRFVADMPMRNGSSKNAQTYVHTHFDWDMITKQYIKLFTQYVRDNR